MNKIIFHMKDTSIVRTDLLPTADDVRTFYAEGGVPEEKARFISQNYETKVSMLDELQHGRRISLYHEKHSS